MADKKPRKSFKEFISEVGVSFKNSKEIMQSCGPAFVVYTIALIVLMGCFTLIFFIVFNKGYEHEVVPDVVGKNIYQAELILQEKEFYPRLQMRYADTPGLAGQVISQSPKSGTVAKGGSRITLVVSRGIVFDHVKNYVGSNLDALKTTLDALYAGAEIPSLTIGTPIFKIDGAPAGTILEQEPPEGTPITQPIELKLIVSSGPQKATVQVPDLNGKTIKEVLSAMANTKLTFDFTQHVATGSEIPGTVVKQTTKSKANKSEVAEYSHVLIEFAMPEVTAQDDSENPVSVDIKNKTEDEAAEDYANRDTTGYVHGIFSAVIPEYPYAVPVKLDVIPQEGSRYGFASFSHVGGNITVPYAVPHGAVLVLSVLDREVERVSIQ